MRRPVYRAPRWPSCCLKFKRNLKICSFPWCVKKKKKKTRNKNTVVTSCHFIVSKSFFSLYSKWWPMTWNISSQHASNIHDVFLHGALNVKTWFSHGVFWTGYKTNNNNNNKTYPKTKTHEKKQPERCQRRSGRKFDSIYKRSSRVRKCLLGCEAIKVC